MGTQWSLLEVERTLEQRLAFIRRDCHENRFPPIWPKLIRHPVYGVFGQGEEYIFGLFFGTNLVRYSGCQAVNRGTKHVDSMTSLMWTSTQKCATTTLKF